MKEDKSAPAYIHTKNGKIIENFNKIEYRIQEGTETFRNLDTLYSEFMRCNNTASDLIKEHGFGSARFITDINFSAGGIYAIESDVIPVGFELSKREGFIRSTNHNDIFNTREKILPRLDSKLVDYVLGIYEGGSYSWFKKEDYFELIIDAYWDFKPNKDTIKFDK